jgi:putative ABC transport system permease protein
MRRGALILLALASHWRRRPLQLATLLVGLTLATALWSGVQAINAEARASYARAAQALGAQDFDRLARPGGGPFDQSAYVALRRAGWPATPLVEGRLRRGEKRVGVIGIDPLTRPGGISGVGEGGGSGADLAAFLTPPGLAYAAPETIAALDGVDLGGLALRASDTAPANALVMDVGAAQRLLGLEGRLTAVLLPRAGRAGLVALETAAPDLVRLPPQERADPEGLTASFHLNLTAFALLAFVVGLFIAQSAVGLAFEQRRPLVRTLRALGAARGAVLGVMAAELGALALVAGGAGVLLGWLVAALLMPGVAATLSGLYGADAPGTLALRPGWALSGLAMALLGAGVAGARGLIGVARMPLLAAGQSAPWALAALRALRLQAGAALALLAALPLALLWGGLVGGFAALACLLLAAALALPPALDLALRGAGRLARGALAQWFVADTRQQLSGLSLALAALMLALAANIGVGVMVGSFRHTFVRWLDQRLVSELYVTARTEAEGEAIRAFAATRADAVLPIWSAEAALGGAPGKIYGVVDHATYRGWPLLEGTLDIWNAVAAGRGVVVNEQLARRARLALGASLPLPGGALPVVGVYPDYGNPAGQAIIGMGEFARRFPHAPRLYQAIRIAPERAGALAQELRETFDLPPSAIVDQAQAKAASLRIFERTFAVTDALNLLTLGVAGVALFAGLLTLAAMRLARLAPVWAAGLPRRRLAALDLARTLALAAGTALYAIPVGLALAWMLLAVVNVEAFGWRLPMLVDPALVLRLALAALAVAALAAGPPAWSLARVTPARLLRVFADER